MFDPPFHHEFKDRRQCVALGAESILRVWRHDGVLFAQHNAQTFEIFKLVREHSFANGSTKFSDSRKAEGLFGAPKMIEKSRFPATANGTHRGTDGAGLSF